MSNNDKKETNQSEFYKKLVHLRAERDDSSSGSSYRYSNIRDRLDYEKEERLRIIRKRVLTTVAVIAIGVGIVELSDYVYRKKYTNSDGTPKRVVLNEYAGKYATPFSKCYETIVENGKAVDRYKAKYIYFLVNKETKEIKTYVMIDTTDYNKYFTKELFEFDTEELIMIEKTPLFTDFLDDKIEARPYYEELQAENEWIPLTNCSRYIDGGMDINETYTKEEIESIKDQVLNGYIIINKSKLFTKTI